MSACDSVLAAVLQEGRAQTELGTLGNDRTRRAANNRTGNLTEDRSNLELLSLGRLSRAVTQRDVRDLMRHDASDFAFGLGGFDHPAVQEHRSARQGERVDFLLVHHVEGVPELRMPEFGRDGGGQRPADRLDVALNLLIVEKRQFLADFRRRLATELHIVGHRVAIARGSDLCLSAGRNVSAHATLSPIDCSSQA